MRRSLVKFHRLVGPMREAVSGLMRHEQRGVSREMYPYYQDVYDHILRVSETADALRDLVGTIVETNLSVRDYRQNIAMKKVTSWAAIIAVPTLITGYYGMNVPVPRFQQHLGLRALGGADRRAVGRAVPLVQAPRVDLRRSPAVATHCRDSGRAIVHYGVDA